MTAGVAGEGSVVQQFLVAKLAEVEASLEQLDGQADWVAADERKRLVDLSARLMAGLSYYAPADKSRVQLRNV